MFLIVTYFHNDCETLKRGFIASAKPPFSPQSIILNPLAYVFSLEPFEVCAWNPFTAVVMATVFITQYQLF